MIKNSAELNRKIDGIARALEKRFPVDGGGFRSFETYELKMTADDNLYSAQDNFNPSEVKPTGFFYVEDTFNNKTKKYFVNGDCRLILDVSKQDICLGMPTSRFINSLYSTLVEHIAHNPSQARFIPVEMYDCSECLGEEILTRYEEIKQEENLNLDSPQDRADLVEDIKLEVQEMNKAFNEAEKQVEELHSTEKLDSNLFARDKNV